MTQSELNQVLAYHKKWLNEESDGKRADLSGQDLSNLDMRGADMRGANMREADMREADMRGADMDFASWPLWCGAKGVIVDARLAAQLAAHFCVLVCDYKAVNEAQAAILPLAQTSHRAKELGLLDEETTDDRA